MLVKNILKKIYVYYKSIIVFKNNLILKIIWVKLWKKVVFLSNFDIDNPRNLKIWDYTEINPGCTFNAINWISIWKNVLIAKNCWFFSSNHIFSDINKNINEQWMSKFESPIVISDNVWVWYNSIILKGVSIWQWCVIWAWSVVTKDIPPYSIVWWVPAKILFNRKW